MADETKRSLIPTSDQVNAFMRHVYTALGTAGAIFLILGLSQSDLATINQAVQDIGDGLAKVAAGLTALVPILSALYASWTASRASKIKSLQKDSTVQAVITTDTKLADSLGPKVIAAQDVEVLAVAETPRAEPKAI